MGEKYKKAGVDIEKLEAVKNKIKGYVKKTLKGKKTLPLGLFAGGVSLNEKKLYIVATTDGVGTKLLVAKMAKRYDTVGKDLVYHSVNDLISIGAHPLFFQDYIAFSEISPQAIAEIIKGITEACRKENIPLAGGETAQLPGVYKKGDFELAGTMVGILKEDELISGEKIKEEDVVIGFASNGLHTNGYSLARKIFFEKMGLSIDSYVPGLKKTLAEELLRIHKSYRKEIDRVRKYLKGIAHITGGGFYANIQRILPPDVDCVIEKDRWKVPPIFRIIQEYGKISEEEMYGVFNMGIGMVVFVHEKDKEIVIKKTKGKEIGYVVKGKGKVLLR